MPAKRARRSPQDGAEDGDGAIPRDDRLYEADEADEAREARRKTPTESQVDDDWVDEAPTDAAVLDDEDVDEDADVADELSDDDNCDESDKRSLCGLIKRVKLSNFMNHSCIDIPFGQNVNFIIGQNGSGKSALLTALIVGLGGKVSLSGRGSKTSTVIKHGQSQADIVIELHNQGPDAYKPEVYGKVIQIHRTITEKQSVIRIKSTKTSKSRTHSTSKAELNAICDQFNIQVDNPIAVLNQDMSKSFFASTKPEHKYKMFMKATQMDMLQDTYRDVGAYTHTAKSALASLEVTCEVLEQEARNAEEKFNRTKKLQEMTQRVNHLKVEMACAALEDLKNERQVASEEKAKQEAEIAKLQEQIRAYQEKIAEQDDAEQSLQRELNEISSSASDEADAVKELSKLRKEWKRTEQERKKNEKERNVLHEQVKSIKERIRKENDDADAMYQSQVSQAKDAQIKIEEKEKLLTSALGDARNLESQIRTLEESCYDAKQQEKNAQYALKEAQRKANEIKDEIKNCKSAGSDRLAIFGPQMKALLKEIDRANWAERPVGPLAMHVKLKFHKWMVPVNIHLQSMFKSFLVFTEKDKHQLARIMGKIYKDRRAQPVIYATKKEPRFPDAVSDKPKDLRKRPYQTIDDVVEVNHDQVWNAFVVHGSIHRVILFEDPEDAKNMALKQRFHEATTVYSGLEGDTYGITGPNQVKSVPARYKNFRQGVNYLQDDMSAEEDRLLSLLEQNNETCMELKAKAGSCYDRVKQYTSKLSQAQRSLKQCEKTQTRLEDELTTLRNAALEEDEFEMTQAQTQHLEDDIRDKETQIDELSQRVETLTQQELEARKAEKPHQEKINEAKARMEQLNKLSEEITGKLQECASLKDRCERRIKRYETKAAECRDLAEQYHVQEAGLDRDILEEEQSFKQLGVEPVGVTASLAKLSKEYDSKRKVIEQEESRRGQSIDEIKREYHDTRQAWDSKVKEIAKQRQTIKVLQNLLEQRTDGLQKFREHIGKRAAKHFKQTLRKKHFEGRLQLDHNCGELTMTIDVDGVNSKKAGAQGLSGGEKSFSTACFIVSLWEAMETPFRCLDEFDVFMDAMIRQTSIEMMIDVAKQQPDRQFIYLSPLGMKILKSFENDSSIKVIRMPNPPRGQTNLDSYVNAAGA